MKQLWGAVFLLAVLVGAGWAASLGQTTALELRLSTRFAQFEADHVVMAARIGGVSGALRVAEARLDDLERRVLRLETRPTPSPRPVKRPTPIFARCGRIGC